MKTEPILSRSIIEYLFDGCKKNLYVLLDDATKHQVDFTIRISSDGSLSFESRECTDTNVYLKSIIQTNKQVSYVETRKKGN